MAITLATTPSIRDEGERFRAHYDELANLPFKEGYVAKENVHALLDELFFQRAVQTYLWALPSLNMYGMKEGSEKVFGKGYNILPIFKKRLNAKTLITTPNSDVIYALGYLDLKEDGPMVIEVPPGLQGILDDFRQRPIPSEGEIDGRRWSGDVGLPGPDKGKGGKYLILPPDYKGEVPPGYFTYRSGTYGVFVFWRGFFKDPKQLEEPVRVMEQTRIYPLGKKESAKPMQFPDASGVPANMLYPQDGTAFDMLARFIEHEYVDPADMEMRGMAAALGIVKGEPFAPDAQSARAARQSGAHGHPHRPRERLHAAPAGEERRSGTRTATGSMSSPATPPSRRTRSTIIDARTGFFTYAYSASPGMAVKHGEHRRQISRRVHRCRRRLPARRARATSCICPRTFPPRSSGR